MRKWHVGAGVLAIGVVAGLVAFYLSMPKKPTEADAVKMIRERRGHWSHREELLLGSPITEVNLGKTATSDADLKALRGLTHLTVLDLENTQVTDAGLKELMAFKQLTSLNLAGTQVTDAGLRELTVLKELTSLNLRETRVTDTGLRALADMRRLSDIKLPHLTDSALHTLAEVDLLHTLEGAGGAKRPTSASEVASLTLSRREITDDGLKVLKKLPNLSSLSLSGTSVTDAGMKDVGQLTQLTSLMLSDTRVTDKGLRELSNLTRLTALYLSTDQVTDESLAALIEVGLLHRALWPPFPAESDRPGSTGDVRSLSLRETKVTSAGLKCLKKLPKLAALDLRNTQMNDFGLKALMDLKQLEALDLSHTDVTDEGLKVIKELKQLTRLDLWYTKVTDSGIQELLGLSKLSYLGLGTSRLTDGSVVTDRSLKWLADAGLVHALWMVSERNWPKPKNDAEVRSLDLSDTQVTGAGLKELRNLKQLDNLRLRPSQITDAALKTLAEFGVLHALDRTHPEGPPFGEAWSEKWSRPKNADAIWILSLYECKVTDESLKVLAALKNLQTLDLQRTHVTDAGVKELRTALPGCNITR